MRRPLRLTIVPLVALIAVVALATPASAHALLLSTDPGDGSGFVVGHAPHAATMHFSEAVTVKLGGIRVYDDRGRLLQTGAPSHPGGDDATVRVPLPDLGTGTYVVTWRVISADTHPVGGAFTFRVGASRADVRSLTTRLLSAQGGSRTVGVLYGVARAVEFGSLLALIGCAAFLVLAWPKGRRHRRSRRVVRAAWWTALGVTVVGFGLEGIYAAGFPLRDVLQSAVLRDTWHSRYGEMAALRAGLLIVALPLLRMLVGTRRRPGAADRSLPAWWSVAASALAVGLCATVSLAGHAVTGRWQVLALPADLLHLLGGSLWFGGLLMLVAVALGLATATDLDRIVPRYSRLAAGSVTALVVSGTFQSVRQVGTFDGLTSTSYGRILLVKLGAFVVVAVLAALSHEVVRVWYRAPEEAREKLRAGFAADAGGGTGRASPPTPRASEPGTVAVTERPDTAFTPAQWARGRLLRTAAFEVVVLVVVLAVTALLVNSRPSYDVASGPAIATMKTKSMWFNVIVDPATVGPNEIHLYALTPTGRVANPLDMSMTLTNKARDVGPLEVHLVKVGPGHKIAQGFQVPFAGDWQVGVTALLSDVDEVSVAQTVTVR